MTQNYIKNNSIIDRFTKITVSLFVFSMFSFSDSTFLTYVTSILTIVALSFNQLKNKRVTSYFFWGLNLCIINLATIIWAPYQMHALRDTGRIFVVFLVCFLVSMWTDSIERLHHIFSVIIISSFVMSIRILIEVPFEQWGNRFSWIFGVNVNPISMKIMFSALLALYFFYMNKNKKKKIFFLFYILFSLGIVLLLGSRRAILLFVVSFILFVMLIQKNKLKPILLSLLFIGILYSLLMNVEVLYNIVGERLELTINTIFSENTVDVQRSSLLETGIELFLRRPFLGWGADNFEPVSRMGMYSHNNYIELLANTGIVGFFSFYSIHIILLIKSKLRTNLDIVSLVLLATIIFSDFAAPSYSVLYIHLFICLIIAYQENINYSQMSIRREK